MRAAGFQFFTAAQSHDVFAARLRLQMSYLVEVHDGRAVNPRKTAGVQKSSEARERHPGEERAGPKTNLHVVTCRFNEVDLMFLKKKKFTITFYQDPVVAQDDPSFYAAMTDARAIHCCPKGRIAAIQPQRSSL